MERYELRIKPSAVKEIERVPRKRDRVAVVRAIEALADEPRPTSCRKLSGREYYRLRRGDYRIVYSVEDNDRMVVVVRVGHRRDVYR